jgi:putative alpha-1,2-mannosidase
MQYIVILLVLWLTFIFLNGCFNLLGVQNPLDYIDPKIGTTIKGKRWMSFPGVTTPFGMITLRLVNHYRTCWYKGVFDPHLGNIMGFSHIQAWTMAGLLTMPTMIKLKVKPGPMNDHEIGYGSHLSDDVVSPGYYVVTLDDYKIRAEFTTPTESGFHRDTFPATEQPHILFDLMFNAEKNFNLVCADLKKISNTEIIRYSRMVEKNTQALGRIIYSTLASNSTNLSNPSVSEEILRYLPTLIRYGLFLIPTLQCSLNSTNKNGKHSW